MYLKIRYLRHDDVKMRKGDLMQSTSGQFTCDEGSRSTITRIACDFTFTFL